MTERGCGKPENDREKVRKAREWQRKGAESQKMTEKRCGKLEDDREMVRNSENARKNCGKLENDRKKLRKVRE